MVLGGVAVGLFVYFVFGAMKKSDVFVEALKRAQNSSEVQAAMGTPIETGWMMQGSFNYENGSGTANFNVPLKGPKGEGTLTAVGEKAVGGPWIYSQLEAVLPDGSKVNLNPEGKQGASTETGIEPPPVEEETPGQ